MKQSCIFILLFSTLTCFAQQWELKKNQNDIKVYTRALDSTQINEYKAVLIAKTTMDKTVNTILDGNNLWRWNHKTSQSKIIEKISEDEYIFWMKNDLPWPIKNRDNVSRIKVHHLPDNRIRIDITPDNTHAVKEYDCCIRVTNFKGYWLLSPLEGNKIEIIQQLYGDPNGIIPAWVLNSILTTVPYHTFLNLKDILEN